MNLTIDASLIDKSLPVPVGRQLYGLLSYQLSHGDIPKGTKLPSVRTLARDLGIAQATVGQVFRDLRDAGLVEMRKGSGAYSRLSIPQQSRPESVSLRGDVDVLLDKAEQSGVSVLALLEMIGAQAQLRRSLPGLNIVFVGVFAAPAADYLASLRPVLSARDRIRFLTIEQLQREPDARAACLAADLVITFLHRESEVVSLVPDARLFGLRFIPSNTTREALARIDPRARVAAVTQLFDYIAIMKPSVQRFAPHVVDIRVSWSYADDLASLIEGSDVVIYASGAEHVCRLVPPGVACFEYRHAPDPAALENELLPRLNELRAARRGSLRLVAGQQRAL